MPVTVVMQSGALIMGLNPTQGIDVCACLYSVVCCIGRSLAIG